jgi:hypothetical protein
MAHPGVDGGDSLQIRRAAADVSNKQSGAADKGWFPVLGVERGAKNSRPKKKVYLAMGGTCERYLTSYSHKCRNIRLA